MEKIRKIRDKQPGRISESLKQFFGLKYFNFFIRIQDRKNSDPGFEMDRIRIRDKHPGSATLSLSVNSLSVLEKKRNAIQGLNGRDEPTDGT
jgi:hypothetical protein